MYQIYKEHIRGKRRSWFKNRAYVQTYVGIVAEVPGEILSCYGGIPVNVSVQGVWVVGATESVVMA